MIRLSKSSGAPWGSKQSLFSATLKTRLQFYEPIAPQFQVTLIYYSALEVSSKYLFVPTPQFVFSLTE
jgi:hypothetical protein